MSSLQLKQISSLIEKHEEEILSDWMGSQRGGSVFGGAMPKEGDLKGFTLAGADKVFHPAKAEIRGNTIVVSAADVSSPMAVRCAGAPGPATRCRPGSGSR